MQLSFLVYSSILKMEATYFSENCFMFISGLTYSPERYFFLFSTLAVFDIVSERFGVSLITLVERIQVTALFLRFF
jgi:hypothetical protein